MYNLKNSISGRIKKIVDNNIIHILLSNGKTITGCPINFILFDGKGNFENYQNQPFETVGIYVNKKVSVLEPNSQGDDKRKKIFINTKENGLFDKIKDFLVANK